MPTYQYTCTECGEPLEAVQKFTDAPLAVCPACGGRLRKVFSAVGIVFKGSGFYRTDSRNGSSATAPAAKDKEKSSSESASTSDSTCKLIGLQKPIPVSLSISPGTGRSRSRLRW